jgi:chemotaxis receptor (MCP) glutamine deamidase CheD
MRIHVKRGDVYVGGDDIFNSSLSTCVSVCLYHPQYLVGGMNHIFGSRTHHGSPSCKYIKREGYYYADNAIPRLLSMLKDFNPSIRDRSLHMAILGGFNNEGPITETLNELGLKIAGHDDEGSYLLRTRHDSRYKFKLKGYCINNGLYRNVVFDIANRRILVNRRNPGSNINDSRIISL